MNDTAFLKTLGTHEQRNSDLKQERIEEGSESGGLVPHAVSWHRHAGRDAIAWPTSPSEGKQNVGLEEINMMERWNWLFGIGLLMLALTIAGCGGQSAPRPPELTEPSTDDSSASPKQGEKIFETGDPDQIDRTGIDEGQGKVLMMRSEPPTSTEAQVVEVFYATDRKPLENQSMPLWRHFRWSLVMGIGALACGAATFFVQRRRWVLIPGGILLVVTLISIQVGAIGLQRELRAIGYGDRSYGSERHESNGSYVMELGRCEVSIPPDHRVGRIESPSILRLEFTEDAKRHVILERVQWLENDDFHSRLRQCVDRSAGKQAFVFVHGYNVPFDDAVKRTAQIAHDLAFDGPPICYSWPSHGELQQYTRDETNAEWTVLHLENFLLEVVERTGVRQLHLIAHSMGNRPVLQVAERLSQRSPEPTPFFGELILAAPDVDAAAFVERYAPAARSVSRHVTLYASSNDRALQASTGIHGFDRAGLSGPHLLSVPGLETIDVSPIDTSLIGHSYYGDNPLMIQDLRALVELGQPAAQRSWLEQALREPNIVYWVFRQIEEKLEDKL